MSTCVTVRCHAKLNLGLEVVGRRPDGYHDLVTLFQSISLCDTLVVTLGREGVRIASDDPEVPVGADNICHRAVEAFREAEGLEYGVTVEIEKQIPAGGGLGGGSADAAGTLLALQTLTGRGDDEGLRAMARELGADVPFFLTGGTCLARGIGEQLSPVSLPSPLWFVVCRPGLTVSTAEAYRLLSPADFSNGGKTERLAKALANGDLQRAGQLMDNAFFGHLAATKPVFLELECVLLRTGAHGAGLTGSGACMFGLFPDEQAAREAQDALPAGAAWSVVACSAHPALEVCDLRE